MAEPVAQRKIEAFHLNVAIGDDPLDDYSLLGPLLIDGSPHSLRGHGRYYAFHFEQQHRSIVCVSYEGDPDAEALLYDTDSGKERLSDKRRSEIVATRTHFAINLPARVVAFEFNQRGTKIRDFEDLLQLRLAAQIGNEDVAVSIVPIAGQKFLPQLAEFERIQSAKAVLVKPNAGWLDANSPLLRYGAESNAKTMTVEAKAGRAEGLSRREGIVADVRRVVKGGITAVREAVFWGTKDGRRQQLKLSSQTLKTVVQLKRMDDGQPDQSAMREYVLEFCENVAKKYPGGAGSE